MKWTNCLILGLLLSSGANATMYSCDNNHTLMVKDGKVVLDTTDVYYPTTDASGFKYDKNGDTKSQTIFMSNSITKYDAAFGQHWSRKDGFYVSMTFTNGKVWDYKNEIFCKISNPYEEPPVPPAQLN